MGYNLILSLERSIQNIEKKVGTTLLISHKVDFKEIHIIRTIKRYFIIILSFLIESILNVYVPIYIVSLKTV